MAAPKSNNPYRDPRGTNIRNDRRTGGGSSKPGLCLLVLFAIVGAVALPILGVALAVASWI